MGIESSSETNAPTTPASRPTRAPSPAVIGAAWLLLEQIRRRHAAADHPETAAQVAGRNDRQRRQHADDETTDERGLSEAAVHG